MKQLLLRVDEALHASLGAQARASGKSVNALANEILSLGIDPARISRRDRLQLKLIAVGEVGRGRRGSTPELDAIPTSAEIAGVREHALSSMRGAGPLAESLIDFERGDR